MTITFNYNNGTITELDYNATTINGAVKFAKSFLKEVMFQNSTARATFWFDFGGESHEYYCFWRAVGMSLICAE